MERKSVLLKTYNHKKEGKIMCGGGDDVYTQEFQYEVAAEVMRRGENEISKSKKINFNEKEEK